MPESLPAGHALASAVGRNSLRAEARDTERVITLWQQKISDARLSAIPALDLDWLAQDGRHRFVISTDEQVEAGVLIAYGPVFGQLLDLPKRPSVHVPLIEQVPSYYRALFVQGCRRALAEPAPVRLNGAVAGHDGVELFRAAFMQAEAANGLRRLIFGSFNRCIVSREMASAANLRLGIWKCDSDEAGGRR